MPTEQVSLSLDEGLVQAARDYAGRRGLSSYVNRALNRQLQRDRILALLDEMEKEAGPIDEVTMKEVRREWPSDARKRRRSA